MYQLATEVWNQIAATQKLSTEWGQTMFPLPQNRMDEELEVQQDALMKQGLSGTAIVAAISLAPLLWEHRAITAFVRDHRPDLLGMIPEVLDVDEAINLARMDHHLSQRDESDLYRVLSTPPTSTSA